MADPQAMPAARDLIVAMAAGDSEALRSLNARYGRMLAALARRFLNNESDAEEVVADVLWQAWRDAKTFDAARGSVTVWLVTLARSRAIDRLRANRGRKPPLTEPPASEPVPDPALELHQVQRARIVRTAIAGLTANERAALLDKGFRFSGQRFGSLSAIARKITGSRWSGPLFFGLKASSASEANHGAK